MISTKWRDVAIDPHTVTRGLNGSSGAFHAAANVSSTNGRNELSRIIPHISDFESVFVVTNHAGAINAHTVSQCTPARQLHGCRRHRRRPCCSQLVRTGTRKVIANTIIRNKLYFERSFMTTYKWRCVQLSAEAHAGAPSVQAVVPFPCC